MHFQKKIYLFIFAKYTLTLKHISHLGNLKSESSIKSQAHYTIEWQNFGEYIIAMTKNEWEENDVKEFVKLLEQSERAWKPVKEK
jgi:hypothetical protein